MTINSRAKGGRGERELVKQLNADFGPGGRRTSDGRDQKGCGDIVHPALPTDHIECKRVERVAIQAWIRQAVSDCDEDKTALVIWRTSGEGWRVDMSYDDWVKLKKGE